MQGITDRQEREETCDRLQRGLQRAILRFDEGIVKAQESMAEHRRLLKAASSVLGVPHHDPQAPFEQLTREQELFFPQDRGHANAAGLDRIAEGMSAFLLEQKLVP